MIALLAFDIAKFSEAFRNYIVEFAVPFSVVAAGLGLLLLGWILSNTLLPILMRRRAAQKLFTSLAVASGLTEEEEEAMRELWREEGFLNPAIAFVRPGLIEKRVPAGLRDGILEKLFGEPSKEAGPEPSEGAAG